MPKPRTIALECPGCRENLQLDAGFAGGVCRCFRCGQMMTVPSGERERAEVLVRPSRPTAPGAAGGAAEEEMFTTASGRTIRLVAGHAIPTAVRRRVVRWTTYAVFAAATLLIVLACAAAIWVLVTQAPPAQPGAALPAEAFVYDPAANPYTITEPNALGLPLRARTAIVLDASASSEPWLAAAADALARGLSRPGSTRVEVLFATAAGPRAVFGGMTALDRIDPDALIAASRDVAPAGVASLDAGVAAALDADPTHLILVTSQRIDRPAAAALLAAMGQRPDVAVDVAFFDGESVTLDDLRKTRNGRYAQLSTGQLAEWRDAAGRPIE